MTSLETVYHHAGLNEQQLQAIIDAHQKVFINKGDYLLKEGQVADEYYCLESGLIRSFVTSYSQKEITTGFFGNNEIVIDVVSLFLRVASKENIQALTDCVCWKIDFDIFQKLFHDIGGFSEWGRSWMSECLFHLKMRTVSMITDSAGDRYLALLKQHPEIFQHAPLKHIATYLGITDTSLSRIRKEVAKGNF